MELLNCVLFLIVHSIYCDITNFYMFFGSILIIFHTVAVECMYHFFSLNLHSVPELGWVCFIAILDNRVYVVFSNPFLTGFRKCLCVFQLCKTVKLVILTQTSDNLKQRFKKIYILRDVPMLLFYLQ